MIEPCPSRLLLTGLDEGPMQLVDAHHKLHEAVLPAFKQLQAAMAKDGMALTVASGWRSFSRQAAIWQAKCTGSKVVYNSAQQPVDVLNLSAKQRVEAIMLYSALPGASRHHWGTDLDVFDANAVSADYQLRLQPSEYQAQGPFYAFSQWLEQFAGDFGFFLPYRQFQGGVAAEPWHLSYAPLAEHYQTALTPNLLVETWRAHPIAEQDTLKAILPELFERFIKNICKEHP